MSDQIEHIHYIEFGYSYTSCDNVRVSKQYSFVPKNEDREFNIVDIISNYFIADITSIHPKYMNEKDIEIYIMNINKIDKFEKLLDYLSILLNSHIDSKFQHSIFYTF